MHWWWWFQHQIASIGFSCGNGMIFLPCWGQFSHLDALGKPQESCGYCKATHIASCTRWTWRCFFFAQCTDRPRPGISNRYHQSNCFYLQPKSIQKCHQLWMVHFCVGWHGPCFWRKRWWTIDKSAYGCKRPCQERTAVCSQTDGELRSIFARSVNWTWHTYSIDFCQMSSFSKQLKNGIPT